MRWQSGTSFESKMAGLLNGMDETLHRKIFMQNASWGVLGG